MTKKAQTILEKLALLSPSVKNLSTIYAKMPKEPTAINAAAGMNRMRNVVNHMQSTGRAAMDSVVQQKTSLMAATKGGSMSKKQIQDSLHSIDKEQAFANQRSLGGMSRNTAESNFRKFVYPNE